MFVRLSSPRNVGRLLGSVFSQSHVAVVTTPSGSDATSSAAVQRQP
jgi:hypothetical protein